LAQSSMVLHQIPTSSLLSLAQSGMVLHQIQVQNHTSKTVETKSKTIRPNRLFLNSYVGPYCSLQCGQLELSCTCNNDVGISIFLFDHTMPNLTSTTLRRAPVENIAITSAPWAHYEIAGKAVPLHPIKLHVCHVAYIARGSKKLIILCTNLTIRLN
jgi:hypothetical protein